MKKLFALFFAVMFIFGGCVSTEPEIDPDLVTMEIISSSPSEVSFVISNNSKDMISFGEEYSLEHLDGENWTEVPETSETFFIAIAHLLEQEQEYKTSVNLERRYGKLSNGIYRIAKNISMENDLGEIYGTRQVKAEFEVIAIEK